jgi:hypothetical protein
MREQYAPLFDRHGTEVGTLVSFPSGTRRLCTDPRTYTKLERGGYKIPPRLWPLHDADGEQMTALALVPGSENRTEAA